MTMGRAFSPKGMARLARRAHRLYDLHREAAARGAHRRAVVLRLMSDAYNSAGMAWFHRQTDTAKGFDTSILLFEQADLYIDRARALSENPEAPTVAVGGTA